MLPKNLNRTVCSCILLSLLCLVKGQNLSNCRTGSYYTYVYVLTNAQVQQFYAKKNSDKYIESFLTQPIDSFCSDSGARPVALYKKPGYSHYVLAKAYLNKLRYELVSDVSFGTYLYSDQKKLFLFVYDKHTKQALANAQVKLGGKSMLYDPVTQSYLLPHTKKEKLVSIRLGEEEELRLLESYRSSAKPQYLIRAWTKTLDFYYKLQDGPTYQGYIAFNKPKYLPHDTVKLKAYVVTKKGKPLRESLSLMFGKLYSDDAIKLCELKPVSPGAYVYQFVLSDSLTIDASYTVKLCRGKRKHEVISRDFLVEDYQLDESFYTLETEKENFYRGEPVTLIASGKDANGQNLLDARVRLTLKTEDIGQSFVTKLFVPNVLWTCEQVLDPKGNTRITVPDSIFPKTNLELTMNATFLNGNNESISTGEKFAFWEQKRAIDIQLKDSELQAKYLRNGKEQAHSCTLKKTYSTGEVTQTVTLPYKETIDPFVKNYRFESDSASGSLDPREESDEFFVRSYRTHDSVFIRFVNPKKLNVAYTIYKGETELATGSAQNLNWKAKESGTESYYVHYHYLWGGKENSGLEHIPIFEKALQVELLQPATVRPGEKARVTVQVNDVANKPVKDVNVTAFALTKQFSDPDLPELPYLGKPKYSIDQKNDHQFKDDLPFLKGTLELSETWRTRMKLDTLPYYRMLYPEKGIHYHFDSIKSTHAEVAPFLFLKGSREDIYLVLIDQRLAYYYDAYNSYLYSLVTKPGYHSLTIRTYDKTYRLDSVFLKPGLKTEIGIDSDRLPATVKVEEAKPYLSDIELEILRQSTFAFHSENKHDIYVWQGDHICFIPKRNYGRGSVIYKLCGFFPDSLNYTEVDSFSQKLLFEPGYLYSVKKSLVKMQDYTAFKHPAMLDLSVHPPAMGAQAMLPGEIRLRSDKQILLRKVSEQVSSTEENKGALLLRYKDQRELRYAELRPAGRDSVTRVSMRHASARFYNLVPGYYNLKLITDDELKLETDSFFIKPGGTLLLRLMDKNLKHSVNDPQSYHEKPATGRGSLYVTMKEDETGEEVAFANVIAYQNGVQIDIATTDENGKAKLVLPAGKYTIKGVYVGYETMQVNNVVVNTKQNIFLNLKLNSGGVLLDAVAVRYEHYEVSRGVSLHVLPGRLSFDTVRNGDVIEMVKFSAPVIKDDGVDQESFISYFAGNTVENEALPGTTSKPDLKGGTRNRFSDYAYWKPNLITDKSGQACFEVMFPDNITGWQGYALAMDGHKHSGSGSSQTQAKLPLAATLSLPRFLVEGDSSYVTGKALNYTGELLKIKSSFSVEGRFVEAKDTVLKDAVIQSMALSTGKRDSLKIGFGIESETGMRDAEERSIPVLPAGSLETEGSFVAMQKDTSFTLHLKEGETEIYVQQNSIDFLLKQLQDLQAYPHACMEQTASKLKAYLMEEKIRELLGQKFKHKAELRKLIKRLDNSRKEYGGWGWWEDSPVNTWMTCYVLDALWKAQNAGYKPEGAVMAARSLQAKLPLLKGNELLTALHVLSERYHQVSYEDYLNKLDTAQLNFYQQLVVMRIRQKNRLSYNIEPLLQAKKTTLLGNCYWGEENRDWFGNSTQLTLLAYELIAHKDSLHPDLPLIRNYFLELKQQDKWRNTIETARILETLLPAMLKEGSVEGASLELSGAVNQKASGFPYATKITGPADLVIRKKGKAMLYFTAYRKRWNKSPQKKEEHFVIRSFFESKGKQRDTLYAGLPADLVVEVEVKHSADYLMLEIPIPAGCSYANTSINKNALESHRENFKNSTNIFCEHLPAGKHVFRIALQPRFKGVYTLNPARIGQMYFPVFYGSNGLSKTQIR